MLFSFSEIAEFTGGQLHNLAAGGVEAVVIDNRNMPDAALFVAIQGVAQDGHKFVRAAIEAGAVAALVSHEFAQNAPDLPLVAVDDPLTAMGDLARAARARSVGQIAAVTGSVGKTTSKEILRQILNAAGSCHASIKSYNNHWGVPLMLSNLPAKSEFGVFEIGMNHSGEITPLTQMVLPHTALITAVGEAHIGELGSLEAIAHAKAEIFSGLVPGGTAVINVDHVFAGILVAAARNAGAEKVVTFGYASDADVTISYAETTDVCLAKFAVEGREIELRLCVKGKHMASNAVGAALVAHAFGVSWESIIAAVAQFDVGAGRGSVEKLSDGTSEITLCDESYNANPQSMRAALDVFAGMKSVARRILVLGDMRELGENSRAMHEALAKNIRDARPDEVYLVGADMAVLADSLGKEGINVSISPKEPEMRDELVSFLDQGDLIMLKGSNGVGLGRCVEAIKSRFDRISEF